ncbi:hypothetical protein [Belliella pelovolcani]|uniref:hypothetical protein n=1 Tax=Belliella pelovolcani TaxID=529505 RepID=UPI00391BEB17
MKILDFVGERNLEESAGLEVEVLIADYQDVEGWPTAPDILTGDKNEEYVIASGAFTMKEGTKFHRFQGSLEKNSFVSNLVGPRGAKSPENTLTIQRNAANASLTGWIRANRNRELVVAFRFLGETLYSVIGWQNLWAEVDEGTIDVPGEISGEKMTMVTIRSIFHFPYRIDAIPLTPAVA